MSQHSAARSVGHVCGLPALFSEDLEMVKGYLCACRARVVSARRQRDAAQHSAARGPEHAEEEEDLLLEVLLVELEVGVDLLHDEGGDVLEVARADGREHLDGDLAARTAVE